MKIKVLKTSFHNLLLFTEFQSYSYATFAESTQSF